MTDDLRIRQAVRGLILDTDNRVLLVRFEFPHVVLWAAPGGGLELDEDPHDALGRELAEETGLLAADIGPVIWTRTHVFPFLDGSHDGSHDGQAERFYLVRTEPFEPRPTMSWEELNSEGVTDIRWWSLAELHASDVLFAPKRLAEFVARLIAEGPPATPIDVGV